MRDGDLRRIFRENLKSPHWVSVETGMSAAGVPDSNYCFPGGVEGWIEFKKTPVRMRPAQIGWLLRRSRSGGRCFIGVRDDEHLFLIPGRQAEIAWRFRESPWHWRGGPLLWDWAAVERVLRSGP